MYQRIKIVFTLFLLTFTHLSFSQQFTLEHTIGAQINTIIDLDGDGICEYIVNHTEVYDGATHTLKYTLPVSDIIWTNTTNTYSVFPHIDYNSDGNRDLVMKIYTPETAIIIFDVVNNNMLFEFTLPQGQNYLEYQDLIDIDGDGELEMIIFTSGANFETYIYSSGVQITSTQKFDEMQPSQIELKQNYPNPFNPTTNIQYSTVTPGTVSVKIFDISGKLLKEFREEHAKAGEYRVIWDGRNNFGEKVSSGAYFYQISTGGYSEAKKMILLR